VRDRREALDVRAEQPGDEGCLRFAQLRELLGDVLHRAVCWQSWVPLGCAPVGSSPTDQTEALAA